ncbi:unnamed protein product [Durusdinium trenchii]|uniref:Mitochondrial protein n=2 Tax=Durusdinium trenchii TaxID=1381693 RepID=A0ABP0LCR7_9DINO
MEAFAERLGGYHGPIRGKENGPFLLCNDRDGRHEALTPHAGRFSGPLWYNSLFWPNFPGLNCLEREDQEKEFYASLSQVNSDGHLAEQYVTFAAAREDLCHHGIMPQESMTIRAEVMQYDGVRDSNWYFPLQDFIPKRGNHTAYESQSRRSCENGAITLGLNAEDFSDSVLPVSQLLCHITMSIEPPTVQRSNREGHSFVLLSLGGWPFRVRRIGTFEGLGDHGRVELSLGSGDFNEEALWQLLGVPGLSEGEPKECQMGGKYWCQLLELDWLGPKKDDQLVIDSEIPLEKGYIWFRVLCAESSGTALRVELLEDGVVPAWLDLRFLQVWAGDIPLGYLNKALEDVEGDPFSCLKVLRTLEEGADDRGIRKVYVENSAGHLVFDDPLRCSANQLVDLGWSIHEVCYRGARLSLRPHPGSWSENGVVA